MRSGKIFFCLFLIIAFFNSNVSYATHAVGIDLSYTCLGNNRYEVTLNFYRDCTGQSAPGVGFFASDPRIDMIGCGVSSTAPLRLQSSSQVPAICPQQQNQTTCNGGNLPGVEQYVYRGTITVPPNCPNFRISYRLCCRNNAITNLANPGGQRLYAESIINNTNNYCNNSPVFTTLPVPYICAGEATNYNHGAVDIDGDGLVYSLIDPLDNNNTPINHTGGTSATNPIRTTGPFQFDNNTGQMSFTPQGTQNAVVTILVEEYRNGVLVGSTMRDIQALVLNCNNNSPTLTGINGTTDYTITSCSGNQICFDVLSDDLNGDNVTMTYNNGIPGGVFTVSGSSSAPVGNFCWDPTGFNSGNYQFVVTVEDDACPIQGRSIQSYNILLVGGNFSITAQGSVLTCPDDNNGTASVTLNGGTPPYSISWNTTPPQSGLTATNLTAGTYTVLASDSGGCATSATAIVSEPDSFDLVFDNTPAVCNGQENGTITLTASGANPGPYSYNWSEPGVGDTTFLDSLSSGAYLVTVTDVQGCTKEATTFVFQPGPLVINLNASSTANYNGRDISCAGASDGEITVIATGGTQPYIYDWSSNANGQSTAVITGLEAGSYFVTVSDSNGCNTGTVTTISDPPPINTSIAVATDFNNQDISCYGFSDGAAVALPNGGTPPYTFQWDNNTGNQTTDTAVGLSAGNYNVTVYDANLCPIDTNISLNEPDSLGVDATSISDFNGFEIACNGTNNGSVLASVSGGTGFRTVEWSDGTYTEFNSNLFAGSYTITVTDVNNCLAIDSITLSEPPVLNLNMNIESDYSGTDISCFGASDGTASANPSGGVGPYLYSWFPNETETDSLAEDLEANTWYRVVVADANECLIVDSVILSQPDSILLDPQVVSDYNGYDVSCYGASDGIVDVSGIGGVPPYSYEWEDGQITAQASGISAGNFSVTATDQNGCEQDTFLTVGEPDSISADYSITSDYNGSNISCFGASDGSLLADASGGVGPYQYTWGSNVSTPNQADIDGLSEDWYVVNITDANSCMKEDSIYLEAPEPIIASARGVDVVCAGDVNGRVFAEATGGSPGYTYLWDDASGQIANEASGLAPGTYSVIITDANGCLDSATTSVGEPDSLLLSSFKVDPTCFGDEDGLVRVDVNGGVSPYQYSWDDLDRSTTPEIDQLFAGNYEVEVTDSSGCLRTLTVALNNPPELNIEALANPDSILFGQTSDIITTVTNNIITPNFGDSYEWTPIQGLDCTDCPNPTASPQRTTTYNVEYTDSRSCKTSEEVTIVVDINNRILFTPNAFTPNGDGNNDFFMLYGEGIDEIELKVFDRWGEQLFQSNDINMGWDGTHNGNIQSPGVFIFYANIIFTDGYEEELKGSVTLIR